MSDRLVCPMRVRDSGCRRYSYFACVYNCTDTSAVVVPILFRSRTAIGIGAMINLISSFL